MRRQMRQTRTLLAIAAPLLMVLVAACAMPWGISPNQQPQPAALPTVVHSTEGLLRPVAPSTTTVATTPLTVTSPLTVAGPPALTVAEQVKLSTEQQMAQVIAPVRDLRELAMRL